MAQNSNVGRPGIRVRPGDNDREAAFSRSVTRGVAGMVVVGALVSSFGCAKSGVHLEGTVTIDGNPVAEGKLQFVPQGPDRKPPVTADIKDGRYSASSVPLGKVQVRFSATKPTGRMIREYSQPYPEIVSIIPKQYEDGIAIEVTGDQSTQNFELTTSR
jgi:hypothetical protein